LTQQEFFY